MRYSVARDMDDSTYDFQRLVWPAISKWCGGGEYYPAEGSINSDLQKNLDMYAGIDGFQKIPSLGVMRGIASRIQWGETDWRTFTIRASRSSGVDTEIAKRIYAIENADKGFLYPHLTVHAYISVRRVGELLSVAIARTKEIIPYAVQKNNSGITRRRSYDTDGSYASFLAVDWREYKKSGNYFVSHPDIVLPVILDDSLDIFDFDLAINF